MGPGSFRPLLAQVRELEPLLCDGDGPARLIWTSSRNAQKANFSLQDFQHRGGQEPYSSSKYAMDLLSVALNRKLSQRVRRQRGPCWRVASVPALGGGRRPVLELGCGGDRDEGAGSAPRRRGQPLLQLCGATVLRQSDADGPGAPGAVGQGRGRLSSSGDTQEWSGYVTHAEVTLQSVVEPGVEPGS